MRKTDCLLILVLTVTLTGCSATAHRRGVIFEAGAGIDEMMAEEDLDYADGAQEGRDRNGACFPISWMLGYAFTDRFFLTGGVDNAFLSAVSVPDSLMYRSQSCVYDRASWSFIGAGAGYFFRPSAPSPYVQLSLGRCRYFPNLASMDGDDVSGLGVRLGLGYEVTPHLLVELAIVHGKPSRTYSEWYRNLRRFEAGVTGATVFVRGITY